jgi:aminoglycoside phosphotransferase (APT) family kinase protein
MLNVRIKTIPHRCQEYDTVGNYWRDVSDCGAPVLEIRVSRMRDRRYEFLVALHEMIEAFMCERRGLPFGAITRFDIEYERNRRKGEGVEPGASRDAPYRREHRFAERIERIVAGELRVDWRKYGSAVARL